MTERMMDRAMCQLTGNQKCATNDILNTTMSEERDKDWWKHMNEANTTKNYLMRIMDAN